VPPLPCTDSLTIDCIEAIGMDVIFNIDGFTP